MAVKELVAEERIKQFLEGIEAKIGAENKKSFVLGEIKDSTKEDYDWFDRLWRDPLYMCRIEKTFKEHPEIFEKIKSELEKRLDYLFTLIAYTDSARKPHYEEVKPTRKPDFEELSMGTEEPATETSKFTIPAGLKEKPASIDGTILGMQRRKIEKAEKSAQVIVLDDRRKPQNLSPQLKRELSSYAGSFLGGCIVKFEEQRSAKQITKEKILTDPELLLGYISQIWLGELEKGAIKLKSALIAYRDVLNAENCYEGDRSKIEEIANLGKEISSRISDKINNDSSRKEVCDPGKIKNEYLDNLINDYQQAASLEKEEKGLKEIREKIGETIMAKINDDITTPLETIKKFEDILKREKGDLTTTAWINKLKLDKQFVYNVVELDDKGQKKEEGGQKDEKRDISFFYGNSNDN